MRPTTSLCDRLGVVQSMGRVGSALDNAAAESFNSPIKVEYIHRHRFATRAEARLKIATWITDFYNTRRTAQRGQRTTPGGVRTDHQRGQEPGANRRTRPHKEGLHDT